MVNLKDFLYFQKVYETHSIHRAAEHLFISSQGLGKIIKNLEQEYNTTFFIRSKNGVLPTESAKVFYEWSKELVLQDTHMRNEIKHLSNKVKRLRIGCANGVLRAVPLNTILGFASSNSDINVEWSEYSNEDVINKLLNYELEYGLIVGLYDNSNFEQIKLYQCNLTLYVYEGHHLCEKEKVSLKMLRNENIIIMNEQFHMYNDFINACKINGFTPNITAKTMDGGTLFHLCKQKIGVAISPKFEEEPPKGLKAIAFEEPYYWDIYGTCRTDTKDEAIEKLKLQLLQ